MKEFLTKHNQDLLGAYHQLPSLIQEHAGIEEHVLAGGYGYRQILELVQNGADAILEAQSSLGPSPNPNRIRVAILGNRLYVANTGAPLSTDGLEALLSSHSSPKRGNQIGRFGLGFKSLLRLQGRIDLFTKSSGAIRFDPERCRQELKNKFKVSVAPALRLAWPLDDGERFKDQALACFDWAETIVRAEVNAPGILDHLRQEIQSFPAEFLLFFRVATNLSLDDDMSTCRQLSVVEEAGDCVLKDGQEAVKWRVARGNALIKDEQAVADATHLHARDSVPIDWAIPLDAKNDEIGRFWAFFPTKTPTYLPGILNAPWKLNSDRNSIIGGAWNTALMKEAARLIVDTLPALRTDEDPGRPIDAFPRQPTRNDEDAIPLVEAVWEALKRVHIIPDSSGIPRPATDLSRPPRDKVELAREWLLLASPEVKLSFVHPTCLERNRLGRIKAFAERIKPSNVEPGTCNWLRACLKMGAGI